MIRDLFGVAVEGIPGDHFCARCSSSFGSIIETPKSRRDFKQVTGLAWPGGFCSLSYLADRDTLRLPSTGLPRAIRLCLPCCVAYMTEFNVLLKRLKQAPRHFG